MVQNSFLGKSLRRYDVSTLMLVVLVSVACCTCWSSQVWQTCMGSEKTSGFLSSCVTVIRALPYTNRVWNWGLELGLSDQRMSKQDYDSDQILMCQFSTWFIFQLHFIVISVLAVNGSHSGSGIRKSPCMDTDLNRVNCERINEFPFYQL